LPRTLTFTTIPRPPVSLARGVPSSAGRADVLDLLTTLVVAALVTGIPVVCHLAGQPIAIAICVVVSLLVANFAAPATPTVLIFSYLFQNFFVALISPQITDLNEFNSIRAYNFISTAVFWVVIAGSYWIQRATYDPRLRVAMNVTTIVLAFIAVYFAIGVVANPRGATVYLRNIVTPFLFFQICLLVAYRFGVSAMGPLVLIGIAALIFGYLEMFAQDLLFKLINGDVYLNWRIKQDYEAGLWLKHLQETGFVFRTYLDALAIDFLNTPFIANLSLRFYRLVGPNFHSISFAYFLAILSVVLAAAKNRWYAVLAFPLLLIIGSKGALIFVVLVIGMLATTRHARGFGLLAAFAALLVAYTGIGLLLGMRAQDYHVLGFIGGLNGFLRNPFGRGIGAGGNLSLEMAAIDWTRSQNLGQTDIALESSVGVLLYQMGIFGFVLLAVLGWMALKLWSLFLMSRDRLLAVAALSILAIAVNGIFQEEALFAPLAVGTVLVFAGLSLGRAYRALPAPTK
jgi:hypothetical protein